MRVSNHAVQRFIERGRLFLYPHEITDARNTILRFIHLGHKNLRLDNVPFYKNIIGCDVFIYKMFKFYVKDNTVLTCVVTRDNINEHWRK